MKKKFYPKLIFPLLNVLVILFFVSMISFFVKNLIENISLKLDFWTLLGSLFFLSFVGLVIFHLTYFLSFYFKFIVINDNEISIFELNKLKMTKSILNEIEGYSKSEVYFGRHLWKSKSIVIYFKNGIKSEIVNVFVSNLTDLEKELKKNRIKNFGFESYKTGWFFREYKFRKK